MKKFLAYMDGEPVNGGYLYKSEEHGEVEELQIFDFREEDAYAGDYVYGDTELEAMEDVANFVAESYLNRLDEGDVMRDDRYPIIPYIKIVACDNGEVSFAQVIFKENGSRPKGIIHLWVEEVEEEEE